MIRALLAARYVTFTTIVLLLVWLAWTGKRVSYEQSISSFFAEDDPDMAVYQEAAKTFGDDNFVFLVYDDPELVTPKGLDGFPSWPPRSRRGASRRCSASSRLTPCPYFGRSTTPCWHSTACPGWLVIWRSPPPSGP